MRRALSVLICSVVLGASLVGMPAFALVSGDPTTLSVPHINEEPATSLDSVVMPDGSVRTYWLANGFLYSRVRSAAGIDGSTTRVTQAEQIAPMRSKVQATLNSFGDLAVVFSCGNSGGNACYLITYADGSVVGPAEIMQIPLLDFQSVWVERSLRMFYSFEYSQLNLNNKPRSGVQSATIAKGGFVQRDGDLFAYIDMDADQYNVSSLMMVSNGPNVLMAWESFETKNRVTGRVLRAAYWPAGMPRTQVRSQVVSSLGAADLRIHSLSGAFLPSASGLVPALVWTDQSSVLSANFDNSSWQLGARAEIVGQPTKVDSFVTAEGGVQTLAVVSTGTAVSLESFTITDSRLPWTRSILSASAESITSVKGYQLVGGRPGALVCTPSSISLVDSETGGVVRSVTANSDCANTEVFHQGTSWIFFGIGTNYSATHNLPHALEWVDSQLPIDLSPAYGKFVESAFAYSNGVKILAYALRDWINPANPADVRDRLIVDVFDPSSPLGNLQAVSDPKQRISKIELVEMPNNKVVLMWQESHTTLSGTDASSVKATTFDLSSLTWSPIASADRPGTPIVSLGLVARGGPGAPQASSMVLADASFTCSNCANPTQAILGFSSETNTFVVGDATVSEGSVALAATQLFNGTSVWVFSPISAGSQPRLFLRAADGSWSTGVAVSDELIQVDSGIAFVFAPNQTFDGNHGSIIFNVVSANDVFGNVTVRSLNMVSGKIVLGTPVPIANGGRLAGNAAIDSNGSTYMMIQFGHLPLGIQFCLYRQTASGQVVPPNSCTTMVDEMFVRMTVDGLGHVTIVTSDGVLKAYTPSSSASVITPDFGIQAMSSGFDFDVDADRAGYSVAWLKALDVSAANGLTSLSVSTVEPGDPGPPSLRVARFTSASGMHFEFKMPNNDATTRLEYRSVSGSPKPFSGIVTNGIFDLSDLDLSNGLSLEVRVTINFGTQFPYPGTWTRLDFAPLTVSQMTVLDAHWTSLSAAQISWQPLGAEPYQYEVEVVQGAQTQTLTTTQSSATPAGLRSAEPAAVRIRASLYGVWSSWSEVRQLAPAKGPTAPRALTVKKAGSSIAVQWSQPRSLGDFQWLSYRLEMRIGTGAWKVVTSKLTTRFWTLKKPIRGKKYSFRVAQLSLINGPASSPVSLIWRG